MTTHDHGRYERTDARFGPTFRAGLYILAVMFGTALLTVPFYRAFVRKAAREQPPAASVLSPPKGAEPAFPRLVEKEPKVLAEFRAQEDAWLTSYGWVEKDRGIARMPIEQAMRIVAERGLPSFPAPAATPPASGGAK